MQERKKPLTKGYQEICDEILDRMQSGKLVPGDRLPSESELMSIFGVSKMTAARARMELSRLGIVVGVPGVGTE